MAQSICHIGPTQAIVSSETRASRPIPPSHPLPTQTPRPESKPSLQAPKPQLPKCQHLMNSIDIAACANILIFSTSTVYAVMKYLKKIALYAPEKLAHSLEQKIMLVPVSVPYLTYIYICIILHTYIHTLREGGITCERLS